MVISSPFTPRLLGPQHTMAEHFPNPRPIRNAAAPVPRWYHVLRWTRLMQWSSSGFPAVGSTFDPLHWAPVSAVSVWWGTQRLHFGARGKHLTSQQRLQSKMAGDPNVGGVHDGFEWGARGQTALLILWLYSSRLELSRSLNGTPPEHHIVLPCYRPYAPQLVTTFIA